MENKKKETSKIIRLATWNADNSLDPFQILKLMIMGNIDLLGVQEPKHKSNIYFENKTIRKMA